MQTKHIIFLALLSALVSSGVTALVAPSLSKGNADGQASTVAKEIEELKIALAKEQEFTLKLEQRLLAQNNNLNSTTKPTIEATQAPESQRSDDESASQTPNREERIRAFRERAIARQQPEFRRQNLLSNGFAEDEASWVLQQEAQVQLDSLNEQYRARRRQAELDESNGTRAKTQAEQLREKLGDDYYERYLEANGLPTSVGVNSVLGNSPGANAGLKAGDRILSYGGDRVYNIRELNGLTVLGKEGTSVLIEVERDGSPVQLTVPRGPIGITGGRGRF